ncbi:MAG: exosortase-associated EpsI family protein [Kiritimatiellae bacterium]|nr:exosortase-associated EpsI family protein [Kiritimatiellia bacterium]
METTALKPYLYIIGALIVTILLLAFTVDVSVSNEAGVLTSLPDEVGEWHGDELRFCQNGECQEEFLMSELNGSEVCPKCGAPLGGMSYIEKAILPNDTLIVKKKYKNPDGKMVYASLVMSGEEQGSIHRPQLCLVGQGRTIVSDEVIDVALPGRDSLGVMVLNLDQTVRGGDVPMVIPQYYAYWFVGKDRETPHHLERMFWMAYDRIIRNVAHRWAYISVAGLRDANGGKLYIEEIDDFVRNFYPQISLQ